MSDLSSSLSHSALSLSRLYHLKVLWYRRTVRVKKQLSFVLIFFLTRMYLLLRGVVVSSGLCCSFCQPDALVLLFYWVFFVQILRPKIYIEIENDFMQNKKLLQLD